MDRRLQKGFCGVESILEEVMRSSDEEQQKDAERCISDRESTVSSVVDSAEEEMFVHGLDPVLDRPSTESDEEWNPESSHERQRRRRQSSSSSASPSESASATRARGRGRSTGTV
ncbi:serine/Arginine-related protein 53-like [Rhinichthys klamathensis goyatoka]|uniref:serine/Arginine-related protein 53-like n=1 Tax=Rhinichthys klamathensis goyatoka TaxID=3034132 RepID=UPI0024B4D3C5|nr:serine/Arginine-related protein 53-like [Rhinichthys klamathensis goyatoka]